MINFTVDLEDDLSKLNDDLSDPVKSLGNKILSRRSSVVIHKTESNNENVEETFDQILKVFFNLKCSKLLTFLIRLMQINRRNIIFQVTSHHDAVMAYYFMDENNQVKVTEIFDVSQAESEAIFNEPHEESRTLSSCCESDLPFITKEGKTLKLKITFAFYKIKISIFFP